jgi:hypothetical protein
VKKEAEENYRFKKLCQFFCSLRWSFCLGVGASTTAAAAGSAECTAKKIREIDGAAIRLPRF